MFFCDIGELPFRTLQRRENLSKGCGAFGHGEILTLRLTQHLRIHCGRLTRHSEPTLALLQLLTGGMEAPGHEQKVTLQNQTHHYKIRSAPARSRARQNRGFE